MPGTLAETSGIDSRDRECSASAGQNLFSVTRLLHCCIVTCTCAPFILFNFWRSGWWACFVARRKQWRQVSTIITSREEDWRASAITKALAIASGAPRHICGLLAGRRVLWGAGEIVKDRADTLFFALWLHSAREAVMISFPQCVVEHLSPR